MKRFLMLVGVAVVAAAMYVAASPASQQSGPTAKQFNALKKQVASLSKTVKVLKAVTTACDQLAVPIDQFGNPDGTPPEGYHYQLSTGQEILTTGLDVTDPAQDTGALFITGGDATCATLINPSGLRHKTSKSAHLWSFSPHQR